MNYYFAPMEGLTDSIYRRAHHRFFSGVDRYYMPFLSGFFDGPITAEEAVELALNPPEGYCLLPSERDEFWYIRSLLQQS